MTQNLMVITQHLIGTRGTHVLGSYPNGICLRSHCRKQTKLKSFGCIWDVRACPLSQKGVPGHCATLNEPKCICLSFLGVRGRGSGGLGGPWGPGGLGRLGAYLGLPVLGLSWGPILGALHARAASSCFSSITSSFKQLQQLQSGKGGGEEGGREKGRE